MRLPPVVLAGALSKGVFMNVGASLLVLVLGLALAACGSTSSNGIATSSISADVSFDVFDNASKPETEAIVILKQGTGFTNIQLANGDSLTFATESQAPTALAWDDVAKVYSVTTNSVASGSMVTFALTRTDGASAPSSTGTIPAPVAFTSPAAKSQVSYASGTVPIAWSNPVMGATMNFEAYPCGGGGISTKTISANDTGSFMMKTSDLVVGMPPAGGTCITIELVREVQGKVDPGLDVGDSHFRIDRHDTVDVTVVP